MNFKRYLLLPTAFLFISFASQAQRPFVSSLDTVSGFVGSKVTISGLNFPTSASNLVVHFGGAKAEVISTSENLIEVIVPFGTTHSSVTVTDTSTGLSGKSSERFFLSHNGTEFKVEDLGAQQQFPPDQINQDIGPFDLSLADLDDDGKLDVVRTNVGDTKFNTYLNTSSGSTISMTKNNIVPDPAPGFQTQNLETGDLNGDGKLDLVIVRNNGDRFLVYQNSSSTGSISLTSPQTFIIPKKGENFRFPRRVRIGDLDGDGKPEVLVGQNTDSLVYIYQNQSTSNISLNETPFEIAVNSNSGFTGLDLIDFDKDGLIDILLSEVNGQNVFVIKNTSSPGSLSFGEPQDIRIVNGAIVNVAGGDVNGDGLVDIVGTDFGAQKRLFILLNQSSDGVISFSEPELVSVSANPWGLDFGDLDGNGKLDIVVAFNQSNFLNVLINTSTGATPTFNNFSVPVAKNGRNVKIGDLDNDGRPDIAFVHNVGTTERGDLSVFKNNNCITPVISPNIDAFVCGDLELTATGSGNMTYTWVETDADPDATLSDTDNTTVVNTTGTYQVTLADGLNCSITSAPVPVKIDPEAAITPNIIADSTICPGTAFALTTTTPSVGDEYFWTGPGGFTSSVQNPDFAEFNPTEAGNYDLQVLVQTSNGNVCLSNAATTTVTVRNLPELSITSEGEALFCEGGSSQISVQNFDGFSYIWKKDGTTIEGETTSTFSVSETGSYTATITDGQCTREGRALAFTSAPAPTSSFTSLDIICVDLPVNFEATSTTGQEGLTLNYSWQFGDANSSTSTEAAPTFTYGTAGDKTATLTTGYDEVPNCTNDATATISVQDSPNITIDVTDADNNPLSEPFLKCPDEAVKLILPTSLTNINWTISGTTNSISTEAILESDDPGSFVATGTNEVGCDIIAEVTIDNFADSGIEISSTSIIENDSIILEENQEIVSLTVSGGSNYNWEPIELVGDPASSMQDIMPFDLVTPVTVSGIDVNGCESVDGVTIINPFVIARKSFSPNGDGLADCWEITNTNVTEVTGVCNVIVFDTRGRRLLDTNSPFEEDCVWDGTFSGTQVPAGVYYFAMKCEDGQFNRSGSILLAR
ncbi:MAG: FG-GAP-like repeat-containing protein [Cyclobacteriaceae bacterium]